MRFEPTITRRFPDDEFGNVLLSQPQKSEKLYYQSQGYELWPVYDYGDHVDTTPMDESHARYGYVWVSKFGKLA